MKIAFVVQRYGNEVAGGSESLCKQVAERLSKYYEIEVLTTCAKDYITWRNEYTEGIETINNVLVRRFKSDREREIKEFNKFTQKIFNEAHSELDERKWIEDQGPYVPKMLSYITTHKNDYDLFVFFTYRYYPSFFGLPLVHEKSILVPTAENEPTLNLGINKLLFSLPRAFIYLTEEEKKIINNIFKNENSLSDTIGMGLNIPEDVDGERFKNKYSITDEFILYVGRIDGNKGCGNLFDYFIKYKKENKSNLKLLLIGKEVMKVPMNPDILHLGFMPENDKFDGIKAAKILIMPSQYESYSIVITEAWALEIPTLVNGKCDVLKGQCLKSNGGLYYTNYEEFKECLNMLLRNLQLRERMGENGRRYVEENYGWEKIEEKYLSLITKGTMK